METKILTKKNKETGCFNHFEFRNRGNSPINAYLLAMLNYKMSPHLLLGLSNVNDAAAVALSKNNDEFEIEFKDRIGHWFRSDRITRIPVGFGKIDTSKINRPTRPGAKRNDLRNIEFFYESNERGIDPEVMLISTADYIILSWRGTDRVGNTKPLVGGAIYQIGEWLETDFDAPMAPAPFNIPGRVHRGFDKSVRYNRLLHKLGDRLNQLDLASKRLWITGHSLGGAHAQLSALYLHKIFGITSFAVYAYASPGVGDQALVNELEKILPRNAIQRFSYIYDPVPRVPMGITSAFPYRRAGILNHYTSEQGSNNYFFNKTEKIEFPGPFICHHHTHWYARAAFFELIDKNPAMANKVPNAPSMPKASCGPLDQKLAEGKGNIIQSFFGIDQDLEPGMYQIVNAKTMTYLNIRANDANKDGKPIRVGAQSDYSTHKWEIEPIPAAIVGGYVIKCKRGRKIIDADRGNVGQNQSGIQIWERLPVWVGDRRHQEWEIERLENGRFHIKNMLNNKYILRALLNGRVVLDSRAGIYSEWYFIGISE